MLPNARIEQAALAGTWWRLDDLAILARAWCGNNQAAYAIPANQWEALLAQGGRAHGFDERLAAIRKFLDAAAGRDKRKSGWGTEGFVASLIAAIESASSLAHKPDLTKAISGLAEKRRATIHNQLKSRVAAEFLRFILLEVRSHQKESE